MCCATVCFCFSLDVQGGSDSSALQRVLQDIRKQHPVDKECDTTATLSTEAGTRDVRSGDKENAAPTESREENPFALSESPSPSAGCTSTNTSCVDVKQPTGLKVTSNPVFTEQGIEPILILLCYTCSSHFYTIIISVACLFMINLLSYEISFFT